MFHTLHGSATKVIGCVLLALTAPAVHSAESKPLRWHLVGVISGPSSPFTTDAYFPTPLAAGALVDVILTIDTAASGSGSSSYVDYPAAITSARIAGSDWSIKMRLPLNPGAITVANDDPDYGDMLDLDVTSSAVVPGATWYNFEVDLRDPGGPNPGIGPWAPFTTTALPKRPPALGFFPSNVFYFQARRDLPGQPANGGAYYGQILSLTLM